MDLGLRDSVAFIAGSSRGIGLAIARAFLAEGAKVVVTGRDPCCLEEAARGLGAAVGERRVLAVPGDMTELSGVQEAFERTSATFGRLDIVVANVGSGTAPAGWQLSREDWQAVLDANLLGGMVLATEALARMFEEQRGSLVMVSSIAGSEAIGAPAPYSAAKAALQSAVKSLSRLAGPHGVRVNAVAPGNVLFPGGSWERKLAERREFFKDYIQREVPLKRFGVPQEIADTTVFLASERASFVTGACWVVDGGQTRSFC